MSLGIAIKGHSIVGNVRQTIAAVNFGTSYPTGGEPLSARNFALGVVDNLQVFPKNGYMFEYDYTNSKLKAYYPTKGITPAGTVSAPTFTGNALATHGHIALTVMATETAADSTTFVSIKEGDGTAQAGVKVSNAGGAAAGNDIPVDTDAKSAGTPAGTCSAPAFTGTAVGAQAGTEVPDTTDLSALTNVRIVAIGV